MMGKRRRRNSSSSSTTTSSNSSTSTTSSCSCTLEHSDAQQLFPIMLAALSNRQSRNQGNLLIQKALDLLLLSLLSKSPNSILHSQQTLHIPLLSLLPVILNSKCSEVACGGLEVVGAASLFSTEMNEQIASDEEILKGLITAVSSSKRIVAMAACNALLDLLTTSVGRCRLLEFSALDNLIFCFLQAPKSSIPSISLIEEMGNKTIFRMGFVEDEYPILLLHVAITLINECTLEQLGKIRIEISKELLMYLARLWAEVHKHILIDAFHEPKISIYLSNIRTNNLAASLFRLSMEGTFTKTHDFQEVERSIFHSHQIDFKYFILNHWEDSPLLLSKPSNSLLHDNVFSPFLQFLRSTETVSSFLSCLLQKFSFVPSISSDELDILSFINEAREHIGCPIIYQQDIRVVKTPDSKGEVHFFQRPSESHDSGDPHFLHMHDILRCEEAYNDGYTFAVRGMEFRINDIATISEGLAFLFGQPSSGVNMYLTPPNSQGLARHRDDHCVLVCQISGVKQWKIFPNPSPRLPRLYECVDDLLDLDRENEMIDGYKEFLLREGDILYIPRGFPHEACTIIDDRQDGNSEFSLHLTLAIEIEPPFEWEGFVHVALHHWGQKYNLSNRISRESSSWNLDDVAMYLMHVAIKVIGDVDPTFRKACLVGAISFPSVTEGWLKTHQQTTFNHLLSRINTDTNFNNVASNIEAAIKKHEDLLENMRWLHHLDEDCEIVELNNVKMSSIGMEDIFRLLNQQIDKVDAAFMEVKSGFCKEVVFDDVARRYNVLLEKYRKTRKQYINGMLALNHI